MSELSSAPAISSPRRLPRIGPPAAFFIGTIATLIVAVIAIELAMQPPLADLEDQAGTVIEDGQDRFSGELHVAPYPEGTVACCG